jgi:hypothetical protein
MCDVHGARLLRQQTSTIQARAYVGACAKEHAPPIQVQMAGTKHWVHVVHWTRGRAFTNVEDGHCWCIHQGPTKGDGAAWWLKTSIRAALTVVLGRLLVVILGKFRHVERHVVYLEDLGGVGS